MMTTCGVIEDRKAYDFYVSILDHGVYMYFGRQLMWSRVVVLPLVLISPFVERPSIYILVTHRLLASSQYWMCVTHFQKLNHL